MGSSAQPVAHPASVGVLRTLPEEQVNFITTIRLGSPKPEVYLMMGVIWPGQGAFKGNKRTHEGVDVVVAECSSLGTARF
ncbi:unnamed protein product [Sphagnum tenellum]